MKTVALWFLLIAACGRDLKSDETATSTFGRDAFSQPLPGLNETQRRAFFVGNSYFNQNWVASPASVSTRAGLGPLFNARSCSGCHFKDGRGRAPEPGEPARSLLVRLSLPGRGVHGEPVPEPRYGTQIQHDALPDTEREADVFVAYDELPGRFEDGAPFSLRAPRLELRGLRDGPLSQGALMSARVAPALIGLGLLEGVSEPELAKLEDPHDRDGDGISGRPNRVWNDEQKRFERGRFGWKAEQPSVRSQSAAAFAGDMGLSQDELSAAVFDAVVLYARTLAVPAQRPLGERETLGARLFDEAGCAACHVSTLHSGESGDVAALSERTLHPYTDLLLHDMGDGLADGRPSFEADGREWRTAPLWGLGLVRDVNGHTELLHDGRARNTSEAVLWHGGEASASQRAFVRMNARERAALLSFVESL